nr:PAAR-like domain-containing protein [Fluoribacter dumoffii]
MAIKLGLWGGVISGTFMATVTPLTGAFNVLIDGLPANNLGMTVTLSNNTNTIGIYSVPSQTEVIAL